MELEFIKDVTASIGSERINDLERIVAAHFDVRLSHEQMLNSNQGLKSRP